MARARRNDPNRLRDPLSVVGLFEGIGGIAHGLEQTGGFRHVRFCEIDPYCRAVLRKHWPDVPCWDDVRTLKGGYLRDVHGRIDVLTAGFPCQPASLAGRRKGAEDERWLWPDTARLIGETRPTYVLVENVRGLCSRGLPEVLADLAGMGYDAEWQIVSAASIGAPHLRERVVLVGYAADPERVNVRIESGWSGGTNRQGSPEPGHDGAEGTLADANRARWVEWTRDLPEAGGRVEFEDGSVLVADPRGEGWHPTRLHSSVYYETPGGGALCAAPRAAELGGAWAVEPRVGRVAHGVPNRLDRLRTLGNAVVPQVAEFVGDLILDREERLRARPRAV